MRTFGKCIYSFCKKFAFAGIIIILSVFFSLSSKATPTGSLMTYEGVLTDSNGNPITQAQPVKFQIVYSGTCIVYEETQTVTPGTQGEFSVIIGTANRSDTTGNTADRIFASQGSINCNDNTTQTVSGFDGRTLRVNINGTDLTPDITITSVPTAINSQKLADKGATDFVQIDASKNVSQTSVSDFFGNANFAYITAILNGSYNAPTATTATSATTAGNVTGIVAIANGGTGASTAAQAKTNLGLGPLASMAVSGTADTTTFLRGDGSWQPVTAGVSSVAGRTGAVTLTSKDITDFDTAADGRVAAVRGTLNGIASLDASGKVPSSQLNLASSDIPALDAGKITSGTFSDALLVGLSVDKLISGSGKYFSYKPNNTACADNEILKYDSTINSGNGGWKCAVDAVGTTTETDPTVQSFAKNILSTGLDINASNQLFVKYGAIAGTAVEGNDSRITNAFQSTTTLTGGDLSGTITNPKVERIKGQNISTGGSATGQVLRYDVASASWEPSFVTMTDLRSNVTGTHAFPNSCGAFQTLTFDSVADSMACTNISITKSQISDFPALATVATSGNYNDLINRPTIPSAQVIADWLATSGVSQILNKPNLAPSATTDTTNAFNIVSGTLDAARLPALAGDITTVAGSANTTISGGAVTTPKIFDGAVTNSKVADGTITTSKIADGTVTAIKLGNDVGIWSVSNGDVYRSSGKVGIGTIAPVSTLDVAGDLKISSTPASCVTSNEGTQRYNATAKAMEYCDGQRWIGIGRITNCPTGYYMVGNAGSTETFCIANTYLAGTDWHSAILTCASQIPSAHLCNIAERTRACSAGVLTATNGYNEWISETYDNASAYYSTSTSCTSISYYYYSTNYAVRCCIK